MSEFNEDAKPAATEDQSEAKEPESKEPETPAMPQWVPPNCKLLADGESLSSIALRIMDDRSLLLPATSLHFFTRPLIPLTLFLQASTTPSFSARV